MSMSSPDSRFSVRHNRGTVRSRLLVILITAFALPFIAMAILAFALYNRFTDSHEQNLKAYEYSLNDLQTVTDRLYLSFGERVVRFAELSAGGMSEVIVGQKLAAEDLSKNAFLNELIRSAPFGESSQVSIVDPMSDKVLLDENLAPGDSLLTHRPIIGRLVREKAYLKKIKAYGKNLRQLIRPTVWGEYSHLAGAEPSAVTQEGKSADDVFAAITPIPNTGFSLAVTALPDKTTRDIIASLSQTGNTVANSSIQYGNMAILSARFTVWVIAITVIVGLLLLFYAYSALQRSMLDPLDEFIRTAVAVREGDMNRRIHLGKTTDDVHYLAREVNGMLDRLTALAENEADRQQLQENIIQLLDVVSDSSTGDLSERVAVTSDALGPVSDAFNVMLDSISNLVVQVKESGRQVSTAATVILNEARKIGKDAQRQGQDVLSISTRLQDVVNRTQSVTVSSNMTTEEGDKVMKAATASAATVAQTKQNMQRIRSNVQTTSRTIKSLGDRSLEINAVVELINDISARTNILSLNAAIEASKAGEQGKGFAVVADEIRKLAERTSNSTKEISQYIEEIQIETKDAGLAMEEVTREVEHGWKQSEEAGSTLGEISRTVETMMHNIREISALSGRLMQDLSRISEDVKTIHAVTRETSEGILRTGIEADSLIEPLGRLRFAISSFRLNMDYEQRVQGEWLLPRSPLADTTPPDFATTDLPVDLESDSD